MQANRSKTIVSVIIPTYNSGRTLARAIASVQNQSLRDLEIIVINDCSLDGSVQIARNIAKFDPRVRVIDLSLNVGKAAAMNIAKNAASGDWLAILDADDTYEPERLKHLIEVGIKEDVDLVADNQMHIDPADESIFLVAFESTEDGHHLSIDEFTRHSNSFSNFDFGILKPVIRRSFINKVSLKYNEKARFAEDFYYIFEFFATGGKAYLVHTPLYRWYMPFSPSTREWSKTGSGAWRYDYRTALAVNGDFMISYRNHQNRRLYELLLRREVGYRKMMYYIDAQKLFEHDRKYFEAILVILKHPTTWSMLVRRLVGRIMRLGSRLLEGLPFIGKT